MSENATKMNTTPSWTVVINTTPFGSPWMSSSFLFFDDKNTAQACYDFNSRCNNAVVIRRYNDANDRKHLNVLHIREIERAEFATVDCSLNKRELTD